MGSKLSRSTKELNLASKWRKEAPEDLEVAHLRQLQKINLSSNLLAQVPPQLLLSLQKQPILCYTVTQLDLSKNRLSSVPEELLLFSNLEILTLASNQITQLPLRFADLIRLRKVDISYNQLRHLPPRMDQLTNVKVFLFSNNKLRYIPSHVGAMAALKEIAIHGNPFPETFLEMVPELSFQEVLSLIKEAPQPQEYLELCAAFDAGEKTFSFSASETASTASQSSSSSSLGNIDVSNSPRLSTPRSEKKQSKKSSKIAESSVEIYHPLRVSDEYEHLRTVRNQTKPAQRPNVASTEVTLIEEIGRGSFGCIFRGSWRDQEIAIKKLHPGQNAAAADFFRESSLMLSLPNHPNVVQLLGVCQEPNNLMLLMEWAPRGSLDKFVLEASECNEPLSPFEIHRILLGVARGMRLLADNHIVHRDLAARNILLGENLDPKVADFGWSRAVSDSGQGHTATDMGPVRWMSPENIRDQVYSERSDSWAFGVLIFELLMGRPPYLGLSVAQCAIGIASNKVNPLQEIPPSVPRYLKELMTMCFAVEPQKRPTFSRIVEYLKEFYPTNTRRHLSSQPPKKATAYLPVSGHRAMQDLAPLYDALL